MSRRENRCERTRTPRQSAALQRCRRNLWNRSIEIISVYDQFDDPGSQIVLDRNWTTSRSDHLRHPDACIQPGRKIINCRFQPFHHPRAGQSSRGPQSRLHDHVDIASISRHELMDWNSRFLGRLIYRCGEAAVDEDKVAGELP
jgi:hypothetical protein